MKKEENYNKESRAEKFRSQQESEGRDQSNDRRPPRKSDDRVEGMDEDMDAQEKGNYGHKSQQQAEEDGRRGENHD